MGQPGWHDINQVAKDQDHNDRADNVDSFIDANERISIHIITDPLIQNYLDRASTETAVTDDQVYQIIEANLSFEYKIFETNLYDSHGKLLFSTAYFNRKYAASVKLYLGAAQSIGDAIWVSNGVDPYKRNVINLSHKIYSAEGSLYNKGYLSMTYLETYLQDLYRDVNIDNSNILIVDGNGSIVSSKYQSLIGKTYDIALADLRQLGRDDASPWANENGESLFAAACTKIPWFVVVAVDTNFLHSNSINLL